MRNPWRQFGPPSSHCQALLNQRPERFRGRSWPASLVPALVAPGVCGHHVPGYVSAPVLLGDQMLGGALKGSGLAGLQPKL